MRRAGVTFAALAAALLALPAALLAAPAAAEAKTVRVFAVGPKLALDWHTSRDAFRDKVFGLMDATRRRPGGPVIQDGADDVASHLLGPTDPARPVETARDLVVWPEDAAFFSMLTGQRGAQARQAPTSAAAVASLASTYSQQVAYYAQKYPSIAGRAGGRTLLLALTDVHAHVGVEAFAEMADRYDVWLHAGTTMARDWQVVCSDMAAFNAADPPRLPGGVRCEEESPQKVSLLGEPGRDYAYEATSPLPSVFAMLFDPDGRLVSKQVKTYITPLELGPAEGQVGLDAVPGTVSGGLSAVETPVGTLGFVTSKDAWMPDVVQKLDQRHVDLLLQPEFFVGDVASDDRRMWAPDTLLASGYSDLLRHPSFEAMVLPELIGNLFDLTADAQQHIAVKPRTGRERHGYLIGQPPARGLVDVMRWVVPDPEAAGESFADRRARLARAGRALLPGSGIACPDPARPGPCENGHVEGVLWRDLEVARKPRRRRFRGRVRRTAFTRARAVSPSRRAQRNAAVARRGRTVVVAFEERRGSRDQIHVVRSRNGGRTWSRRSRPTGRPAGSTDEWWPSVAIGPRGRVTVAWVDSSGGSPRTYFARSTNGGRTFGPPAPIDPAVVPGDGEPAPAQWRPSLAAGRGDVVHAAFVDERGTQSDDGLPQAGLWYTRIDGGAAEEARRLDTGAAASLAAKLDNAWAPSVSTRGDRVLVSWIDFLNYDWDVFSRLSEDGGATFAPQVVVNDTPDADEALNDTPQSALGGTRAFVAWTDWRKRASTGPRPHPGYDIHLGVPGEDAEIQVDRHGDAQRQTFNPAACATGSDDVYVAYQDAGRGRSEIRLVRVRGGNAVSRQYRIDDTRTRGGNAWRPELGCWGSSIVAVWEDERDGPAQIYAARGRGGRLR